MKTTQQIDIIMHQLVHFMISFDRGNSTSGTCRDTKEKIVFIATASICTLMEEKPYSTLYKLSSTRHSLHPCVGVFSFYGFELSYMHFLSTRGGNTLHQGKPLNFARGAFMQQQFMQKSNLQQNARSQLLLLQKGVWKIWKLIDVSEKVNKRCSNASQCGMKQ